MSEKEWRDIPGFSGLRVSADGCVIGRSGKQLKPQVNDTGHFYVWAWRSKKLYVHRAVLAAFVGPCPDGQEARHLDGVPAHNDLTNLAWGTREEQRDDERRHGTRVRGELSPKAKLTEEQVKEIRNLHGLFTLRELAKRFGVSHTEIRRAAIGMKWSHVA